ncbi:MAG: hypothetical protein WD928_16460 [Gammaproteobacteria bacterium]
MAELTGTMVSALPQAGRQARRQWPLFVLIGLGLYAGLYLWAESLVHEYGERNRFFMVAEAPPQTYDFAILGASHAMPLSYEEFNDVMEAESGGSIMNLSIEGAGILPNRLVLDYFLQRHQARNVVFFLDSFAFYSPQWNEDRLDSALLARAPLDVDLVTTLARYPWARDELLPYISGFTKINNHDRFAPDRSDAELNKFDKIYRPIPQIDRERVAFLYPAEISDSEFARYLGEFGALIDMAEEHGGRFIVVKSPTPVRYRDALPDEAAFDAAVAELLEARNVAYHDFSEVLPDDVNYYDTDHLNETGVAAFIDTHFAPLLRLHAAGN